MRKNSYVWLIFFILKGSLQKKSWTFVKLLGVGGVIGRFRHKKIKLLNCNIKPFETMFFSGVYI